LKKIILKKKKKLHCVTKITLIRLECGSSGRALPRGQTSVPPKNKNKDYTYRWPHNDAWTARSRRKRDCQDTSCSSFFGNYGTNLKELSLKSSHPFNTRYMFLFSID
jgi:hypothetical protein